MEQEVKLRCPNLQCRAVLSVPEEKRGECVRCGVCGQALRVPPRTKSAAGKPRAAAAK